MATTTHLYGFKTPYTSLSRRASYYQPLLSQPRLDVAVSVPSVSGHCTILKVSSCRGRVLRVSAGQGNIDVLERSDTENQGSQGLASELTCVMKFGGSSVASAERMREVADLILSFPEERPVIVLSAMGKTTNKLLLVFVTSTFFGISFYVNFTKIWSEISGIWIRLEKRLSVVVFQMPLILKS